jgi:hypothetical protein
MKPSTAHQRRHLASEAARICSQGRLSFILGESRHGLAIIQRGMLGVFVADCVHAGSVCLYR